MKRAISVRVALLALCVRACADAQHSPQVARENLIALGVCLGKFTHSNKFILTIGALDLLSQHAKYKARALRMRMRVCARCTRCALHSVRAACVLAARGCGTIFSLQT